MDLENTPAMAPPAGQTSNFDAPMTEVQNDFIVITIGVTTGATVALGLRMWARAGVVGHVGLDDCKKLSMTTQCQVTGLILFRCSYSSLGKSDRPDFIDLAKAF